MWVAELRISGRTAVKMDAKHGISVMEIRRSIECVAGLRGAVDDDPEHGARLIVEFALRGRPALAVLFDAEHPLGDVWNLGSVYFRNEGA